MATALEPFHLPRSADTIPGYDVPSSSFTLLSSRPESVALESSRSEPTCLRFHQSLSMVDAAPRPPVRRPRSNSDTHFVWPGSLAGPFVVEQLQDLPDPVTSFCLVSLYAYTFDVLKKLPDDSRDSQARLLQCIAGFVRKHGFSCTYRFNGMPLEQVRAVVRNDPALSAALRVAFESAFKVFPFVLVLIVRFVCLRPPDYKSPKSVQFAPDPTVFEADAVEECEPPSTGNQSINSMRTFIVADLERTPSPFPMLTMMEIAGIYTYKILCSGDTVTTALQGLQLILGILRERELARTDGFFGLSEAELGDILRQDPPFADVLRRLLVFDHATFGQDLCFVLRHVCNVAVY